MEKHPKAANNLGYIISKYLLDRLSGSVLFCCREFHFDSPHDLEVVAPHCPKPNLRKW